MAILGKIGENLSDILPKSLPSFINEEGKWKSLDDSLYTGPSPLEREKQPEKGFTGITLEKAKEIGKKIIPSFLREIPRSIAELALKTIGVKEVKPETPAQKFLFGEEPIKKPVGKLETGIAVLGVIPGLPGKKQVEKEIAEETIEKVGKEVAKRTLERGFITSVKEALPEIKVAGQYIPRSTDRLAIKAKNLIKSDLETAERIAKTATDDDAVAIGAELIKHYGTKADEAVDIATKTALYERAAEVANIMARNLTEQGKAVQAASILGRLTPEGQIKFAAREIQKYNEAIEKAKGGIFGLRKKVPELSGQQADEILTEMKAIQAMADGTEKAIRFNDLQNRISDLVPSSLYQKVVAVWKAGLLTGIKTSGLNILSNVSHGITEVVKEVPAVTIDKVISLFTGKRTIALTAKGTLEGIIEGFEKGWRYLKTGFDERNVGIKLDYKRVNFGKGKVAKALQTYEEGVFKVIGAEDQPFYYGAKARSLYSQALAQGKNKGLKGDSLKKFADALVENPTDEMVRYAVLDGETAVFQNPTLLGRVAKAIQRIPGGELIVPFGRTPSAVATQIVNYSPIGIVKTIVENIGKGRFDQRLFSQGIARGLTGTGGLFLGSELFKKGLITLDRPTTEKEQKLWELEGRKPNSIKIGNKWRSIQVFGPGGNLLVIGGHFQNEFSKSGSLTEAMSKAVSGSAKSFTEQTFLRGVNQVVDAINDPARSGEGYLGSTLSSAIPTIVSDVARATDPLERRQETILERIQARLPGLREELEPQIDVFGRERESIGNFLEIMADPTRPSKISEEPVTQELRRLFDAGHKVIPTLLGDKKGFESLNQKQNTELWKRAGEITFDKLSKLTNSEAYKELPDDLKAKKIDQFIDRSKLIARVEKVLELTEGLSGESLKKKLSELKNGGLLTREVYEKYQELR